MPTSQPSIPLVILAGGQSSRMGGMDKATLIIGGQPLFNRVVDRLTVQAGEVFVNGPSDYDLGLATIADDTAFAGPLAGVFGSLDHMQQQPNPPTGFVTVPVDGPNVPPDLVEQLASQLTQAAIASDDDGLHPTFAYWPLAALEAARIAIKPNGSLRQLAKITQAQTVRWPGTTHFINLNTPDDVAAFTRSKVAGD